MQQTSPLTRAARALAPLAWIGPAIVLIGVVVVWPVIEMIRSSFLKINRSGVVQGSNGTGNYAKLFEEPDFPGVMARSVIWVVAVVAITILLSLALAQLFNQRFPGRRLARWAMIAPWAASVLMTAIIFKWMLDPEVGLINMVRHDLGLLDALGGADADQLGQAATAMPWLIAVAVFVSLPFTTYALLAGLSTIPAEVYEAAKTDGASRLRTYWSITLPLLRPALTVATLINVMNVFNNFPIIWVMTHGQPGYSTATSTIFMFILKRSDIGESAAMSVVNFGMVIVLVAIFLKVSKWKNEVS
ncbi:carbohydrate ABC transporter permease [Microtetraspora malaysiensis]|uniref:carbohydrate ABC transporter permease n=1 Tax=Microtetraspora malaysiensis TaxID=161358 RepID=UPI00082BE11A|nr:sugar ABC transporter permease [Microtetraspora malaysiensis]